MDDRVNYSHSIPSVFVARKRLQKQGLGTITVGQPFLSIIINFTGFGAKFVTKKKPFQLMAMSVAQASIPTVLSTPAEANIPDKYQMIGFIGNGSFGKVYKVIRKGDNKVLVWKEINYGQVCCGN